MAAKKRKGKKGSRQAKEQVKAPSQSEANQKVEKGKKTSVKTKKPILTANNAITLAIIIGMVFFFFTYKFSGDNLTGAERIYTRVAWAFQWLTEGCGKPPESEVEAYYKDNAGSIPVDADFDADEGEMCGNGRKYFCTSLPPDKPVPFGWKTPPRVGEDPDYEGPPWHAPFKESPHAMPSSKSILSRAPIVDRNDRELEAFVNKALSGYSGKIGVLKKNDLPNSLSRLQSRFTPLNHADFNGDDDAVVAAKLQQQGIDYVLYDRTMPGVKPWMEEKYGTVGMRMRDAVSLHYFFPVVLGSGWALYKRVTPFDIPTHVKRRLTKRARSILSGTTPESFAFPLSVEATGDDAHRVVVSLRRRSEVKAKGRKLVKRMAHASSLVDAVDDAARKLRASWKETQSAVKKNFGVSLSSDVAKEMEDMEIEVDVVYHQTYLADRRAGNLLWYLELGLEGLMLAEKEGAKRLHYLEPSYAVHMEVTSEVVFLEKMLEKAGLKDFLRAPKKKKVRKKRSMVLHESPFVGDTRYDYKRFRTVSWIERPADMNREIVELYRGVPLKTIWDVSYASLIRTLELGAGWLMNNQTPDGQYRYKYTPLNKPGRRWTPGGNIVRHALNPYTLLMVNKLKQRPEYVESAKKGIDFTLKFLRRQGDRCAICHRDPPARYYNAKLNAVAVTILSILKLGAVADISEYEDALACMAEEMLYMQDKNGHYRQYDVPPDHPYYGAESTIHAGEFIFVLARLYSHYKEERFKEACDKSIAYYMKAWDKAVSERTPEGIYDEEHRVNLIGIVPWLVTAMEDLHKMTGDQHYADLAFRAQDWIDNEFFWWQRRAQYPDYVGASFKVHKELPAVNSCQYAEGASAAYAIALRTGHDVENRRQLVVHSMRYCLQLQHADYDTTFFIPNPTDALGGYRYTLGHLRVRNDYNYHAMAAIAQAAEYLQPDDYPDVRPMRILPVLRELLGGRENPTHDMTLQELAAKREQERLEAETAATANAEADTDTPTAVLATPPTGNQVQ